MAKVTTNVELDEKEVGDAIIAAAKAKLPNGGGAGGVSYKVQTNEAGRVQVALVEFNSKG